MRVISGSVGGRSLKSPPSAGTRPTSDLVRGAIFDMTGPYFDPGVAVLDLYAGSGALGIEALSRGAGSADFVEERRPCCRVIQENLGALGLDRRGRVHCVPVATALNRLTGSYDLILLDPPYADTLAPSVFENIAALLRPGGTVVYERTFRVSPGATGPLRLLRERRHGDTVIALYSAEGVPVG